MVVFRANVVQFWGGHSGVSGGGVSPLKMSGIGHLWFLGLCWTFCNRFQVVTFPADLVQFFFWGGAFWASGRGAPSLKISGIGRLLFLGLCWTYCNRFQVVAFPADLAQFWGCS